MTQTIEVFQMFLYLFLFMFYSLSSYPFTIKAFVCVPAGGSAGRGEGGGIEGEEAEGEQRSLLQTAGDGAAEPEGGTRTGTRTREFPAAAQSPWFCLQSQQGRGAAGGGGGGAESQQELSRLKAELDKKVLSYEEELLRKDSAHSGEIKTLRKDLQESEGALLAANKELLQLRDKLDKANRNRWVPQTGPGRDGIGF